MKNLTLYCRNEDRLIVDRAMKLLQFHENKSFSMLMLEEARKIVKKYDGKNASCLMKESR